MIENPLWHAVDADRCLVEGDGIRVRDRAGRWYLDGRSSLWHGTLGHNHPKVIEAITRQVNTLNLGTLLLYDRPPEVTVEFARRLAEKLPEGLRRIRLGSTGSQMVEAAVLLSRYHRRVTGERQRTAVITLWGSYHGQGAAATPLSGMLADRADWCGPLLPDVHHAQYTGSWTASISKVCQKLGSERVTAVVVEPIMGTTGVFARREDFQDLARYCRDNGIHFIADEVSTGYGRVGALSRAVQLGVVPDMVVLAKGITAGYVPAAALVVGETIFRDLANAEPFPHGSTTDGNPLAAAAGLAVLDVLFTDGLIDTVERKGNALKDALQDKGFDVAHAGLLCRVNLPGTSFGDVTKLREAAEDNGLLVSAGLGCLCVLPPLVVNEDECREIADRLAEARS